MDKAAVFSKGYRIDFSETISKSLTEGLLKDFLLSVGKPLANNNVILGHLKMIARVPGREEFIFLSLTQLNQQDEKRSAKWACDDFLELKSLELDINVLVFGHSKCKVAMVVQNSLHKLLRNLKGRLMDTASEKP